jgi:AcrR family transcriptional regulator
MSTAERREQLFAAGKSLFLERPYDQVSIDDVAERAGVSKGLVFHYFGSKRELYVELVRRACRELIEATMMPPDRPPLERLRAGLLAYLDYAESNARGYAGLLTGGLGVDPELARIVDDARGVMAARLCEGLPGGRTPRAAIVARGFVGFVEAATLEWLSQRNPPRDELADLFISVLGAALGPMAS